MVRDVTRPNVDSDLAAEIARTAFGRPGNAVGLPSERDRNFLIDAGDTAFVLKVAHADTTRDALSVQDACLRRVQGMAEVAVPEPVVAIDGRAYAEIDLNGTPHLARMVTYVSGRPLGTLRPKSMETLVRVGRAAALLGERLAETPKLAVPDDFAWDVRTAAETVAARTHLIADLERLRLLEGVAAAATDTLAPLWTDLPVGIVHGDLNDHNVLIGERVGIIDFGDVHQSVRVAEVAVAAAYASFGFVDPVEAVAAVVSGAHAVRPLSDAEIASVVPLIALRLGLSVVAAARQVAADPSNEYLTISQRGAWQLLAHLFATPWALALARVRGACGLEAVPSGRRIKRWVQTHLERLHPVLGTGMSEETVSVVDWSVTSPMADHPEVAPTVAAQAERTARLLADAGAAVGIGRYGEPRLVYSTAEFAQPTNRGPAWRTVHLGVDLSCPAGTTVHAPLSGTIERIDDDAVTGGYGPVLTLRHEPEPGMVFYSLYGHLGRASVDAVAVGDPVEAGDRIAAVGESAENGNWPPHLHFQLMTDLLGLDGPFPGVAEPSQWTAWSGLCPSPAHVLRLPSDIVDAPLPDEHATLARRRALLPKSMSTAYVRPLLAVRGHGVWLYDGWGRAHLDCVNNVAHVGHEHPHVVAALRRQAGVLNTNSRYPHAERIRYLERLSAIFPAPLDTIFLVNSGSEANDLAIRIARAATERYDLLVVSGAYHGHTSELIGASPYKHDGPGGSGAPSHVRVVPLPDAYRSAHGADTAAHVADVAACLDDAAPVAAFLIEPILGVAGQIVPPPGYLNGATALLRTHGGLVIADEVQVGLGRVGSHWWGFERDGAVPDIVTIGKPLGNGHPIAAVITTRAIADAFANGMEYFNTFGGNPVSCAVGNAVLDVIEAEGLRQRASIVGRQLLSELTGLADMHELIGDVRGAGLFIGVELVTERAVKSPAPAQAAYVADRCRDMGVLLSVDGVLGNVLKIKPPLVFNDSHVERLVATLDEVLGEDGARPDTISSRLTAHPHS